MEKNDDESSSSSSKKNEEKNDELCHNDDGLRLIFIEIYIKFFIYVVFPLRIQLHARKSLI